MTRNNKKVDKVLGITIQSNLKWDLHINEVVAKASKRLHILRVLKRGGVPPADLLKVYFALIRSVLEYCCPVWHNALPVKLSDSIERVQKRALRIIFPALPYQEALATTGVYHFTQDEWGCVAIIRKDKRARVPSSPSCSTDSVAGARPLPSQQRQAIPYKLQN